MSRENCELSISTKSINPGDCIDKSTTSCFSSHSSDTRSITNHFYIVRLIEW